MTIGEGAAALRDGRAFACVPDARVVRVRGVDAVGWLQDLLTADVAALSDGEACRTLLLTPTGRIRADLRALRRPDEVVLVQARDAGDPVDRSLDPYVLSSRVCLVPAPHVGVIVAPAAAAGSEAFAPSAIGLGVDLLAPAGARDAVLDALRAQGLAEVGAESIEHVRVSRGIPRMGADFDAGALPAEAGLDDAIAHGKGCYLGQESVARIRNLGHPATLLRHVRCDAALRPGDRIVSAGHDDAGTVTSACPVGTGSVALVRIAWELREAALQASDGRPLYAVSVAA